MLHEFLIVTNSQSECKVFLVIQCAWFSVQNPSIHIFSCLQYQFYMCEFLIMKGFRYGISSYLGTQANKLYQSVKTGIYFGTLLILLNIFWFKNLSPN